MVKERTYELLKDKSKILHLNEFDSGDLGLYGVSMSYTSTKGHFSDAQGRKDFFKSFEFTPETVVNMASITKELS